MNNNKITDWLRNGKEEKAFSKLYKLFPCDCEENLAFDEEVLEIEDSLPF